MKREASQGTLLTEAVFSQEVKILNWRELHARENKKEGGKENAKHSGPPDRQLARGLRVRGKVESEEQLVDFLLPVERLLAECKLPDEARSRITRSRIDPK